MDDERGLAMRILQYEVKNYLKVITKAQEHILIGTIFNASDVNSPVSFFR